MLKKTTICAVLLTAALLSSCDFGKKPVLKTHDWTGKDFIINVVLHPNSKAVSQAYWQRIKDDKIERDGWAGWNAEGYCEIHAVEVTNSSQKSRKQVLGHELLHCIYGTWHEE